MRRGLLILGILALLLLAVVYGPLLIGNELVAEKTPGSGESATDSGLSTTFTSVTAQGVYSTEVLIRREVVFSGPLQFSINCGSGFKSATIPNSAIPTGTPGWVRADHADLNNLVAKSCSVSITDITGSPGLFYWSNSVVDPATESPGLATRLWGVAGGGGASSGNEGVGTGTGTGTGTGGNGTTNGTGDDEEERQTPGLEAVALVGLVAVIVLVTRRRR
jgi:hypothetical protein